jgi:hypothetical protein
VTGRGARSGCSVDTTLLGEAEVEEAVWTFRRIYAGNAGA